MYRLFILAAVLFSCCQVSISREYNCSVGAYPPKGRTKVPTYILNLDLPPEERWTSIVKPKAAQIERLIIGVVNFIGTIVGNETESKLLNFIDDTVDKLDDTLPQPYAAELRGIANATKVPLGQIVLFNIFYELFTLCTSIVAEDSQGKLYHARNLDFGLFLGWDVKNNTWEVTEALRPLIFNVDFQKGGKTLYKSAQFAGYIGVFTAVKPGLFTMSMNERFNADGGYIGIIEWIIGVRDAKWLGFFGREVMEKATGYEDAKKRISTVKMIAPAYYILGGNSTDQGSVETRARTSTVDTWLMKNAGGWYILETNYDHWKAPFFIDDRRKPANICMKKMGQKNVSFSGLFNVLSSKPVLNKLTTYTALMQVNEGLLETWIQNCPDPCYPW